MEDKKIGEHYYRFNKLSADDQGDVYFKLVPVLSASVAQVFPLVTQLLSSGRLGSVGDLLGLSLEEVLIMLPPIGEAIGKWPNEDRKAVIHKLLSCVERKPIDGVWSPIWNKQADMAMFHDINSSFMLQLKIAYFSLLENLSDFFTEFQRNSPAEFPLQHTTPSASRKKTSS